MDTIVRQTKHFDDRFCESRNIELNSPWVQLRTREIINCYNRLFKEQKHEILENDSEKISQDSGKAEVFSEECSETDDDITYEVANRLCNALIKQNVAVKPQSRNSLNENLKWTELYQKLIRNRLHNKCMF